MQGIEHIPWAYDLFMGVVERFGLHRWRLQLASEAGGRTLDLGCGTGRNFRLFGPQTQVIGLELDFRLLARARDRGPGLPLVVGRAEQLPFRADSFDTVVSSLVFCSVADPDKGLGEVARILVSDGQLRMLEHVRSRHEALGRLQDLIQPVWTWVAGGCHPNRNTEDTVEQAGFSIDPRESPGRTTLRCFVARVRRTASRAG